METNDAGCLALVAVAVVAATSMCCSDCARCHSYASLHVVPHSWAANLCAISNGYHIRTMPQILFCSHPHVKVP